MKEFGTFPLPLRVEYIDGWTWRLIAPFEFLSAKFGTVTVPKGMVTDFASIPIFLQGLISPTGEIGRSAVIHDRLYTTGERKKKIADRIFRLAMKADRVAFWKRTAVYYAVKFFGGEAWRNHRKKDHANDHLKQLTKERIT